MRFGPQSTIREVLELGGFGEAALRRHGYEVGEGFVDILSQYQTLDEARRMGRLRDLAGLLEELNAEAARA